MKEFGKLRIGLSIFVGPEKVLELGNNSVNEMANTLFGPTGAKIMLVFQTILIYLLLTVTFVIMLLISLAIVGLPASGILSISENFTSLLAGSLLLVIVMSIATIAAVLYISISYMMTPYIIFAKNDAIGAISAMKYARQLVKGYKWNIFVFELSFIGWWILAILLFMGGALTTLLNPL